MCRPLNMSILKAISLNVSWYSYFFVDFGFEFGNGMKRKNANSRDDIRNAIDAKLKFWSQPKFFARGINYLFIYWSFGSVRLFICLRVFLVSCWRCFVILPPLFQTLRCWRGQISWKTQNKNQKKKHSNSFQSCSCAVLVCVCVFVALISSRIS